MLTQRMFEKRPLIQLRSEMDRLLQRFMGDEEWLPFQVGAQPSVNVWEDDDSYHLEAEVPGFAESDFDVTVCGDELTLRGERPKAEAEKETTVIRRERDGGSFNRIIRLPAPVKEEGVEATLKDGILTLTLPKTEAARTRKIRIKALTS